MLIYLVLGITALTATVQNIFKQKFKEKCVGSAFLFSAMTSLAAMCFFIAVNSDWYYSSSLLLPSFLFAISYAAATVFSVLAIATGPLALSSLIVSCSLLIPSMYGIFVQGLYLKTMTVEEALSPTLIAGIILLIVTLVLVNHQKKNDDGTTEGKVSLKWLIFVILSFLGNGMCSTVQAAKQDFYGNEGNNVFMIIALAIVIVILLICSFAIKNQRITIKETLKKGWLLALLCGIANGLTNFFVIYLNSKNLPASILFPVVSGGGLLLIFLWSVLVKREKFTAVQYIGYALGVISIVLLNI